MNKDNAKDYLPLVQALAEGKTIQWRFLGEWKDLSVMDLTQDPSTYRIKPEPKKGWYRVADIRLPNGEPFVSIAGTGRVDGFDSLPGFVRWLTDRIEYEVE